MKKFLLVAILIGLLIPAAQAAEVTLAWDDSGHPEWSTRIYIGTESGVYTNSHDAGNGVVQTTVANLAPGSTYYFAAKAYYEGQESGFSNEISYIVPSDETILPGLPVLDDSVTRFEITIRKVE